MIEIMPERRKNLVLRIMDSVMCGPDELDDLVMVNHVQDLYTSDPLPHYEDISLLNREYKYLWICADLKFYSDYSTLVDKIRNDFNGKTFNLEINPDVISNVSYDYDLRVGYVNQEFYFLSGLIEFTEEHRHEFTEFIEKNRIDIGVINLLDSHLTVSTVWSINGTRTDYECESSWNFINAIFRTLNLQEFWSVIHPDTINHISKYNMGLYSLDLNYEDVSTKKSLIIARNNGIVGPELKVLIRYKNLESLELHYEDENLELLDLDQYDNIWFSTEDTFSDFNPIFLQKVHRKFKGKCFNLECQPFLYRDSFLKNWSGIGPQFIHVFGYNIPKKDEIPFGPPYIIRGVKGHGGSSNMVVTHDYDYIKNWPWWIWGLDFADYIIEEYIDVDINGTFDVGRLLFVGDTLIPIYALRTNSWEARPTSDRVLMRSVGENSFSDILRGYDDIDDFDSQLTKIIHDTKIDIGVLDFSLKDGRVIPWDTAATWGNGIQVRARDESCNNYIKVMNTIFSVLGNPLRINLEDVKVIFGESELEMRQWNKRYPV